MVSFFNEFRRRLGEGVFLRAEEGLRALTGAIARNGDAVLAWASRVGSAIGAVVARVGSQLGELAVRFLNWLDPGAGDRARELFSDVASSVDEVGQATDRATPQVRALDQALTLPQAQQALGAAGRSIDALNSLAAQTNRPVQDLARELGRIGVQAAEVQLEANRVRDAYDRQLAAPGAPAAPAAAVRRPPAGAERPGGQPLGGRAPAPGAGDPGPAAGGRRGRGPRRRGTDRCASG